MSRLNVRFSMSAALSSGLTRGPLATRANLRVALGSSPRAARWVGMAEKQTEVPAFAGMTAWMLENLDV